MSKVANMPFGTQSDKEQAVVSPHQCRSVRKKCQHKCSNSTHVHMYSCDQLCILRLPNDFRLKPMLAGKQARRLLHGTLRWSLQSLLDILTNTHSQVISRSILANYELRGHHIHIDLQCQALGMQASPFPLQHQEELTVNSGVRNDRRCC